MWLREPGKVNDRIDFLGTKQTCLYLLKGKEAMIIGGGMSWAAPFLESQFSAMDFDLNKIKYLVIPHSHFDHCGAVPYLKRKFPWIQIVASKYCQQVLSKEKVVTSIANINKEMLKKFGLQDEYHRLNLQFNGISVDRVVGGNDIIDLGDGIEAHLIETPGHTRCSIAIYVPALKALFPSDAAPFPTDDGTGLAYPSSQYNFPLYMKGLRKLVSYDVQICGFDHQGIFIGSQAKDILQQGLEHAEKFKDYVIELHQQIGDLDKIARKLTIEARDKTYFGFLSLEFQTAVTKNVVRNILSSSLSI